jgi:integrase
LAKELTTYLNQRRRYVAESPETFLLCRANGSPYSVLRASGTICQLMRQAGFKPAQGRLGPRTHDLRHAFATHRLRQWYRSGADLQQRLPYLSVYLGHQNLLGTEIYLKASSDLLGLASHRMATRFRKERP